MLFLVCQGFEKLEILYLGPTCISCRSSWLGDMVRVLSVLRALYSQWRSRTTSYDVVRLFVYRWADFCQVAVTVKDLVRESDPPL